RRAPAPVPVHARRDDLRRVESDPAQHHRRARTRAPARAAGELTCMPYPPPMAPSGHGLLAGKTVVITAAAGTGIGFAAARRCLEEGARVLISDQHERRLAEASEALAAVNGTAPPVQRCDVTDEGQVQALIAGAIRELGHIDVLINNAGLGGF